MTQILSGIAVGGQEPGAFVNTFEAAPANERFYYVSLVSAQKTSGVVLAGLVAGVYEIVHYDEPWWRRMDDSSWRWCLRFTLPLALPALYLARQMTRADHNKNAAIAQTESFNKSDSFTTMSTDRYPIWGLLTRHFGAIIAR